MFHKFFLSILIFPAFLAITLYSNLSHAQAHGPVICDKKTCSKEEIELFPEEIVVTGTRIPPSATTSMDVAAEEEGSEKSEDLVILGAKILEYSASH